MEKKLTFSSGGILLEALYGENSGEKAVVLTHPHPLMGGDMGNPVVECLRKIYNDMGYSTLRFNFRGAGRSGGEHDNGIGEKDDVKAAHAFLTDLGHTSIDLAGYSFGAYVNLALACGHDIFSRVVLVSPPVDFMDFGELSFASSLHLVVTGENDEYASPGHIKKLLINWNKNAIFKVIPGADHFFSGTMKALGQSLEEEL